METKKYFVIFLLFCMQLEIIHCANILFFFGFATYSHRITVWPFVQKLADRGHNVTFLSLVPNRHPDSRVTEIVVNDEETEFEMPDWINMRLDWGRTSVRAVSFTMPYAGKILCDVVLKDPKVIEWTQTSKYDLVVIDFLYNDCAYGFAYKFNARTAVFGTSHLAGHLIEAHGLNAETNWIPDACIPYLMPLSFLNRVITTLLPPIYHYSKVFYMYPKLESMLREQLDMPDMPSIEKLEKQTELMFLNTHFSEELPRSLPPFVISVAGMHCKDTANPLPTNIAKFIENAGEKGFIYISFGSALQLGVAPPEVKGAFFTAIANTNISFIWRWDYGPRPKNMPTNVHTELWMPQQDILAHPKVRAFVTHGGLLGIQEATYHSVPMIVFPIFAEQDYNAERIQRTGRGIALEIATVTQEKIQNAFQDILADDRYQRNIREASIKFRDRPSKPVDTAVWWTEYILRHKDTSCMRPLESINQFWFQRHLLDVWAFIALLIILQIAISCYLIKKLIVSVWFSTFGKNKTLPSMKKARKGNKVKKS